MNTPSATEIKKELREIPPAKLQEIILRLSRFKKENKELIAYLLFEAHDEDGYIAQVKELITQEFSVIGQQSDYYRKKSIRKLLRTVARYIKYSGSPQTTAELLIFFCTEMRSLGIRLDRNPVLANLYYAQLKKIGKAVDSLHEDLQYDYQKQLAVL